MLSVAEIVERIEKVDMLGLLGVRPGDKDPNIAVVEFWRLGGAFQNDRERKISMVIDPEREGLEHELFFFVPPVEECEPGEMALTIYMDANNRVFHGAYSWKAGEKGDVIFSYALPIPTGANDFPDSSLFGRLLKDMYYGLLFRELKHITSRVSEDLMMSDKEKEEKIKKAVAMVERLTGPQEEECEGV